MNRAQDSLRIKGLKVALSQAVSESLSGFDGKDQSVYQSYLALDPQGQREADLLEFGEEDHLDPAFRDWCQPAKLRSEFGNPFLGVKHLQEIHDSESDDSIEKQIHKAIYLSESQEFNKHDRLMVDVPRSGRRKGGTHSLPPELRRTRSAKVVNEQLLRWNAPDEECFEAEQFYHAANARIARNSAYVLYKYEGPYVDVLTLRLQGKSTKQIADFLGKTSRRIRHLLNGNAQRNEKGLHQFIRETLEFGVPENFKGAAPQIAAGVPEPVMAPVGQLDLDLLVVETEVAA
jgi:hypothetical protein